jgi:hypothetical protein
MGDFLTIKNWAFETREFTLVVNVQWQFPATKSKLHKTLKPTETHLSVLFEPFVASQGLGRRQEERPRYEVATG